MGSRVVPSVNCAARRPKPTTPRTTKTNRIHDSECFPRRTSLLKDKTGQWVLDWGTLLIALYGAAMGTFGYSGS